MEAQEIEHRPILYFFLRRYEMVRWCFRDKIWRDDALWFARIRAIILSLCGHETEICARCGGSVDLVWWCNDTELWSQVTGWNEGGVCCVKCFNVLAEKRGLILRWGCEVVLFVKEK